MERHVILICRHTHACPSGTLTVVWISNYTVAPFQIKLNLGLTYFRLMGFYDVLRLNLTISSSQKEVLGVERSVFP